MKQQISRRQFMKAAGGIAGLGLLAACVPAMPGQPAADGGEAAPAAEPGTLWVLHKQDFHPEYNDFIFLSFLFACSAFSTRSKI